MPAFLLFCGGGGGVHWCRWCRVQGFRCPAVCSVALSCLLCLCCFAFGVLCLDMALFSVLRALLAGFMRFVWVCIALVLCVACVAFVCVSG